MYTIKMKHEGLPAYDLCRSADLKSILETIKEVRSDLAELRGSSRAVWIQYSA